MKDMPTLFRPEVTIKGTPFQLGFIDGFYGNDKAPGYHGGGTFNVYEHGDPRRTEYNDGFHAGNAVNAHDDLVKALKDAADRCAYLHGALPNSVEPHRCDTCKPWHDVIAKAEGR
jgi:hypothetical protein